MTIASLAWDLKAWYGMLMPYRFYKDIQIHMTPAIRTVIANGLQWRVQTLKPMKGA